MQADTSNIEVIGIDSLKDSEFNYFYPEQENFTIPVKSSVVLSTTGRLGNQFFQYAAAYALAKETNSTLYLFDATCASCYLKHDPSQDTEYHLTKFNLSENTILIPTTDKYLKLHKQFFPFESNYKAFIFGYTPDSVKTLNGQYITSSKDLINAIQNKQEKTLIMAGYIENPSLFDKYREEILEQYTIINFDITGIKDILNEVQKKNSVCINVRGKEYLTTSLSIPISYQQEAIRFINENNLIENPNYYVITDDLPYAKNGLKKFNNIHFIEGKKTLEHLYLLSHCSNNIMAISSFSFWGSYLNQRSSFTIIPCSYQNLYKLNHLTYKIAYPNTPKGKECSNDYIDGYVVQYKDSMGNNINEKRKKISRSEL